MVVGPTHARGGTLNLLISDMPDLVPVAVVAPLGNSDHSGSHFGGSGDSKLVLVGKFSSSIKSTGIQSVVQYRMCHGVTFGLLTILLRF